MITRRINQVEKVPTTGEFIIQGHNDFLGTKIMRCSILDGTILVLDQNGTHIAGVKTVEEVEPLFHEYSIWIEREQLTEFQRDQLKRNLSAALSELISLNSEFDIGPIIDDLAAIDI